MVFVNNVLPLKHFAIQKNSDPEKEIEPVNF